MLASIVSNRRVVVGVAVSLVVFILFINFFLLRSMYTSSLNSARLRALDSAVETAASMQTKFETMGSDLYTMRDSIEAFRMNGQTDRNTVIDITKSIIDNNPDFYGVKLVYEPNAYDGLDSTYADDKIYGRDGQFQVYARRTKDGIEVESALKGDETDAWYYNLKLNPKKHVSSPTFNVVEEVEEVKVMSIQIPILSENNEFLGMASLDLTMKYFDSISSAQSLKGSQVAIIDNNGVVVNSTIKEMKPGNIFGLKAPHLSQNEFSARYGGKSTATSGQLDKTQVYAFAPIGVWETGANWVLVSILPEDIFISNLITSTSGMLISFALIAFIGIVWLILFKVSKKDQVDLLTGLYNRKFLNLNFSNTIHDAYKNKREISILMIEIDDFESVGEVYGQGGAEAVIKKISAHIKTLCRKSDWAIRYGEEQFILVLLDANAEVAKNSAGRICEEIRSLTLEAGDHKINKTVSIGISCTELMEGKYDSDKMFKLADQNLYAAKGLGMNRFVM